MGIERKESVVVTYRCDRCQNAHEHTGPSGVPVDGPAGWVDLRISQYVPYHSQVMTRTLCASCATEMKGWFAQLGTVV